VTTIPGTHLATDGGMPRLPFRLARAETLKLRKRRGLMTVMLLLTIGVVCIMFVAFELFHASNSTKYGPAGGLDHFHNAVFVLSQLGSIAAALLGATAGAGDLGAGVFRELVATGRSRLALYGARIPGALALLWPLIGIAFTAICLFTVGLADGLETPGIRLFVESGLWLELATTLAFFLGLGLGSLIGSRATTIAVLFGWIIVVEPILAHVSALGRARDALVNVSLDRIAPHEIVGRELRLPISLWVAVVVVLIWGTVSLAMGAWRTATRDA